MHSRARLGICGVTIRDGLQELSVSPSVSAAPMWPGWNWGWGVGWGGAPPGHEALTLICIRPWNLPACLRLRGGHCLYYFISSMSACPPSRQRRSSLCSLKLWFISIGPFLIFKGFTLNYFYMSYLSSGTNLYCPVSTKGTTEIGFLFNQARKITMLKAQYRAASCNWLVFFPLFLWILFHFASF